MLHLSKVVVTMEWRDVKGYEGKYLISDTGLVKSTLRNGRILKAETFNLRKKVNWVEMGGRYVWEDW